MYVFENVYVKEFVWIRKIIGVIDVWRRRCPAGNACYKNFKCVFLESVFFKLVYVISQILVIDWLEIWKRSSADVPLSHEPRISKSDVFFYFFTTQTMKNTRKIDILNSKCCHFFNFRNSAFSMVHAIAIFILIKMYFDFSVLHNQVESCEPFEPVFKNILYIMLHNFNNIH